tara:strand:- start:320 stop:1150 length:831 start_codon:yes stop_codon:yes gene_type:complete
MTLATQLDELWGIVTCRVSLLSCCLDNSFPQPTATTQIKMGEFVTYETTVVVPKVAGDTSLGLSLCRYAHDVGHPRVAELKEGGAAAASGKLVQNDVIVKVNGVTVRDDKVAAHAIERASGDVTFVVHRTVAPGQAAPNAPSEKRPPPAKAAVTASAASLAKQDTELALLRAQNEQLSTQMASQAESLAGISTFLTTTVGPALAAGKTNGTANGDSDDAAARGRALERQSSHRRRRTHRNLNAAGESSDELAASTAAPAKAATEPKEAEAATESYA